MYCTECLYSLFGLTTPRCPECGEPFDPDDPATWLTADRLPASVLKRKVKVFARLTAGTVLIGICCCVCAVVGSVEWTLSTEDIGFGVVVGLAVGVASSVMSCIAYVNLGSERPLSRALGAMTAGTSCVVIAALVLWRWCVYVVNV